MAIKFDKIKPGMELYDCHSERMGNTTMRRLGLWRVQVISVDAEKQHVTASWNGNPPKVYFKWEIEKFYAKPPPRYLRQQERKQRGGL